MWVWSKLSSAKWKDAWEERFHALEDTSLVITEIAGRPTVRVEMFCRTRRRAEAIRREFGGSVRRLANRDWVAATAPKIEPIRIRDRFLIVTESDAGRLAALRETHPGREVISIPAEMAFGTGDHATTSTCLRFLVDLAAAGTLPEGFACLDLGCGSGLLAIAAARLGAGDVEAIDYDATALAIARKNATANGCPGIAFHAADVLAWRPRRRFDLVFANLFSDVLAAAFPAIVRALAPGGRLVVSGILRDHADECLTAGRRAGLDFPEIRQRGKWVTALGARPD